MLLNAYSGALWVRDDDQRLIGVLPGVFRKTTAAEMDPLTRHSDCGVELVIRR